MMRYARRESNPHGVVGNSIRRRCGLLLLTALVATTTLTEGAELVVFSSGRVLPVETFRIMGDMAAVELVAGGEIWFPSHVVRRIDSMDTDGLSVVMKVKPALNAKNRRSEVRAMLGC